VSGITAIEYFVELEMRWKEFDPLSDDEKAALSIVCFAVTEVNALMRMYAFAEHHFTGKAAIDYGMLAQSHSLLRSWSAKLFEFSEFITFKDKNNRTSDPSLLALSKKHASTFEALKTENGYGAARYLRHETTNHYLLVPVRKNLPHVSDRANCNFYLHQLNGNSHFPMGEEVVFVGRLNRDGAHLATDEEKRKTYSDWWTWNLSATKWLNAVHLDFYRELVVPLAKAKTARRRAYWIDPRLVGVPEQDKLPLFMRKEP
jgi:hypothetical protein